MFPTIGSTGNVRGSSAGILEGAPPGPLRWEPSEIHIDIHVVGAILRPDGTR